MEGPKPVPNALTAPYWAALAQGYLVFQRCDACGHAWLPARHQCPHCLGDATHWERASGQGRLFSWVVYHTAYHEAFASRLPYNVAVVELAEGPRLITHIVDDNALLRGDAPVQLQVQQRDGVALACFRLVPESTPEGVA